MPRIQQALKVLEHELGFLIDQAAAESCTIEELLQREHSQFEVCKLVQTIEHLTHDVRQLTSRRRAVRESPGEKIS